MSALEGVWIDVSVVLGSADLPIRQLLKVSRGTIIGLDADHDAPTRMYAGGKLIAKGQIVVTGERMSIEVTELVARGAEA